MDTPGLRTCLVHSSFILGGADVRYFQFSAQIFETNGQFTFSCTIDDLEDNLKPICRDDEWVEALAIRVELYRGFRLDYCSQALETLLTRIADRQDETLIWE